MSTTGSPHNDIVTFIKGNGKQVLGTRFWDIRRVCRVDAGYKSDKLESKCLVISKFRIFLVSGKSISKLQVDGNFHLLQIASVEIVTDTQLRLLLDGRSLHISITESNYSASALAKEILCAFKHYFPTCNVKRFIELVPTSLYTDYACLTDRAPALHCGCFRRTYAALCDFYKLTYWDEVVWDVEKIYASHETRTLRLEDFDHLAQKDIVSILAVLEFNSWFTGLSLVNASNSIKFTGELLEALLKVVRKNESLEYLELSNCGLRGDFLFALGNALLANPSLPLKSVNLSRNSFEDHSKPITQLATSLTRLETSIVDLDLSDCGIGTKSLNILARNFQAAGRTADSLRTLRLRNNSLKDDLADFYQLLARCSCLVELDLSGSGVALEKLCGALLYGGKDLAVLKLSGCVFSHKKLKDVNIPNSLKNYFTTALALKTVDFSNCNLPAEVIKSIMLGLACNQTLGGVELNLSCTCVDKQVVQVLDTCLEKLLCVESLILRDNLFCDDLTVILPALNKMPNLRVLDLGGNNFSNVRPKMLPNLLVELVKLMNDEEKNLQHLILSDCHLGASMSIVINALGATSHVSYLDISGNGIRDSGARVLAKSLQINTSVTSIALDRNQITQHGFSDISHALIHNYSVVELPYPVSDAADLLTNSKEKDKIEGILQKIQSSVFRNRKSRRTASELDTSIWAKSKITVGNVEEILNKQVNNANRLLNEERTDQTSADVKALRVLLDDAEKTKKVLRDLLDGCDKGNGITESVHKNLEPVNTLVQDLLKRNLETIVNVADSESITAGQKEDVRASLTEICESRCIVDNNLATSTLVLALKENFRTATCDMATAATERLMQEIIIQMDALFKKINPDARGFGSSDLRSLSTTPKQKPKGLPFNRPMSVVSGSVGESGNEISDFTAASSISLDSVSINSVEKETAAAGDDLAVPVVTTKLTHLQKGRPKRAKNVRVSAAIPEALQESSDGFKDTPEMPLSPTAKTLKSVAEELKEPNDVQSKTPSVFESPLSPTIGSVQAKVALKPPTLTSIEQSLMDRSPQPSPRQRIEFESKVPPNTPASVGIDSSSPEISVNNRTIETVASEEPNPFNPPIPISQLKPFKAEASPLHSPRTSVPTIKPLPAEDDYAEIDSLSPKRQPVEESPIFQPTSNEGPVVTLPSVTLPPIQKPPEPTEVGPLSPQEPFKEAVSLMNTPKLRNPKLDAHNIAAEILKKNSQGSGAAQLSVSPDVSRVQKTDSEPNNNRSASRKSMFASPDALKPAVPSKPPPPIKEPSAFRSGLRPTHMSLGDPTLSPGGDGVNGGPPQRPKSIAELKTQFEAQQPPPRPPRKALNKIGPSEGN